MESRDLELELASVHPQGFAWAVRCCYGDRSDAEDVLHQTYVKVLEGKARFDGRSAFKTWLFGVIRRTALEHGRRRWMERLKLGRWWGERTAAQADLGSVAERVVADDTGRRLEAALARLSKRQREILHLVFYQDLTIQEAADVVGIPVGTARTHYERGKARLRILLAEQGVTR